MTCPSEIAAVLPTFKHMTPKVICNIQDRDAGSSLMLTIVGSTNSPNINVVHGMNVLIENPKFRSPWWLLSLSPSTALTNGIEEQVYGQCLAVTSQSRPYCWSSREPMSCGITNPSYLTELCSSRLLSSWLCALDRGLKIPARGACEDHRRHPLEFPY